MNGWLGANSVSANNHPCSWVSVCVVGITLVIAAYAIVLDTDLTD